MLAVLLLVALAWGSTAEFTHHHGSNVRESQFAKQSSSVNQSTATQISSGNTNGTSSKSKADAECLICQLHQNLSATVMGHAPGVGPTEMRGLNAPTAVVFELSEFRACGQGRAPPLSL
jgi:hypothetical protein